MVTVIIPAYKGKYIISTLESIKRQTIPCEIIVSIDGCKDTLEILNKHKQRNLRVFYAEKNRGQAVAINSVIKYAKYDIIQLFGSDDIMKPQMIETNLRAMQSADLVRCKFIWGLGGRPHNTPVCGAIMIRKEILIDNGGFKDLRVAQDRELLNRLDCRVAIVDYHLFEYRRHNESITSKYPADSELRLKIHREMTKEKSEFPTNKVVEV